MSSRRTGARRRPAEPGRSAAPAADEVHSSGSEAPQHAPRAACRLRDSGIAERAATRSAGRQRTRPDRRAVRSASLRRPGCAARSPAPRAAAPRRRCHGQSPSWGGNAPGWAGPGSTRGSLLPGGRRSGAQGAISALGAPRCTAGRRSGRARCDIRTRRATTDDRRARRRGDAVRRARRSPACCPSIVGTGRVRVDRAMRSRQCPRRCELGRLSLCNSPRAPNAADQPRYAPAVPGGRAPSTGTGRSSGTSHTTPSGGSVTSAEHGWPCHGSGSAATPPRLPVSVPP